ncbi:DMT family transporter [Methylobacterium radiodurans]|uniref:EamA family transporter n=1 Tax=Methylobacterium radiodurans TaxID=2202828 RepID=A0A2U8VMM0_9HYPH|nr:DMT family transporter [Methylobacterium radiodurans]AWN34616.1 EamA family transporter [Methylobacterium radiodurans]
MTRPISAPVNPALRLVPGLFVLIWSTGFVVARLVAPHAEPLTFLMLRYGLTVCVLGTVALAAGARWPVGWRGWRDALLAGILLQGIYLDGVFWAVSRGLPAGLAALVTSLPPVLTALVAGPLLGERVSGRRWLGVGIGALGAGLVLLPKIGASSGAIPLDALAVCFAATLALTGGTLWQKRSAATVDLRTNAAVQFLGAGLMTLPLALLLEEGRFDASLPALAGLAWSVLGLSVGGVLLLLWLIQQQAVAGVSALFYLVPAVSAVMAYLLFGETLVPLQVAGMLVAVVGVALASRG